MPPPKKLIISRYWVYAGLVIADIGCGNYRTGRLGHHLAPGLAVLTVGASQSSTRQKWLPSGSAITV